MLSKGSQYKAGIVPMIRFIDAGGTLYGGVNFSWTSVYPASKISQTAVYAYKEDKGKYDIEHAYRKLREEIPLEQEDVIQYCHQLLKIAQYTGSTESTEEFRERLQENPYIPMTFERWRSYLGAISAVLDIAESENRIEVSDPQEMKKIVASVTGPDGLWFSRPTFQSPVGVGYSKERWLAETRKSIFFKSGLPTAAYNVFCMLFFDPDFLKTQARKLRKTVNLLRRDVAIGENLWKTAIQGKEFQALTELDKEILDNRVNFLLGSTSIESKLFDERSDEHAVANCVLGRGGADVMIFRDEASHEKMKALFKKLNIGMDEFTMIVDPEITPSGLVLSENK